MYDYSGFYAQMLSPGALFILIGIAIIVIIYRHDKESEALKMGFFSIIVGMVAIGFLLYQMYFTEAETFSGTFVECYKKANHGASTGIYTYLFEDENKTRESFNMDTPSLNSVYPEGFKTNETYTIYYKKGWAGKIIIGVEETIPPEYKESSEEE